MRIILLSRTLPAPTGVGSSVHVWSLLESLVHKGHEVRLCLTSDLEGVEEWRSRMFQNASEALTQLGVETLFLRPDKVEIPSRIARGSGELRRAVAPRVTDFYQEDRFSRPLAAEIKEWAPDALCLWEIEGVVAARAVARDLPRLAFFTDPDHLVRQTRRKYRQPRGFRDRVQRRLNQIAERKLPGIMIELLKNCDVVVDHAAHHAKWFRDNGVEQVKYLPVPVIDRIGDRWQAARAGNSNSGVARILMPGNLNGTATISGLRLFANQVLPALTRIHKDKFEVHIVGGGKLPPDLQVSLTHPNVVLRGYVDDIEPEFLNSEVMLVPTDSALGFRTRIAEALSYGCCVVAHDYNALGMPELEKGKNVLLASTGEELASAVSRCLMNPDLRARLGAAGRKTFESWLDGRMVCDQMVDMLQKEVDRSAPFGNNHTRLDLRGPIVAPRNSETAQKAIV